MSESVFNPTDTAEIAKVCKSAILTEWSVPCIAGSLNSSTLAVFVVESFGTTYSVTIRKEASAS